MSLSQDKLNNPPPKQKKKKENKMFVSPPPASLTSQALLQRRRSKKYENYSHGQQSKRYDENINTESTPSSVYRVKSNDSGGSQNSQISNHSNSNYESRRDTDFINAPPEYSNRARDEIRKRLLTTASTHSNDTHTSTYSRNRHTSKAHIESEKNNLNRVPDTRISLDDSSLISDKASSIFSSPYTINTNSTVLTDTSSICANNFDKRLPIPHYVTKISLEDALPKTFYDMYTPDVLLSDPSNILPNGRPNFTKRELLDWDLNDIRSLLIVEKLPPEWGNKLPEIVNPGPNLPQFKFQLLPLNSSDNFIISTLVNSDLYMEANLDFEFKLTSARYTVATARLRHEQMIGRHEVVMNLSKPEWRNIIENYLLNIAVEAQCRFDFKQRCSEYKRWKQQQIQIQLQKEHEKIKGHNLTKSHMPPPKTIPNKNPSLLKMTLMKNFNKSTKTNHPTAYSANTHSLLSDLDNNQMMKISLSSEEKANIWSQCQAQVYQRLGLDWKPDRVR